MDINNLTSFGELSARVAEAKNIVTVAHVRPDGDAVGSVMGLTLALRAAGKKVTPMLEDLVPQNLAFLPEVSLIQQPHQTELGEVDLVIALDTANRERVGAGVLERLGAVADWINLDHHGSNPLYGRWNHVNADCPATGQLVYEWIKQAGYPMDDAVRQHLYAAISTDTGSFQYPSTTARTYEIGAEMLAAGLNVGRICQQLYETYPARRLAVIRELLNGMQFSLDNKVASWQFTQETALKIGVRPGDTEGVMDMMRMVDTVVAAVLFEELEDGRIRVSARSKSDRVNVADVCAQFGGGGHRAAAGARISGPMEEVAATYLKVLEDEVRRLD
jgi:phosphoesterase RecJ-like protein